MEKSGDLLALVSTIETGITRYIGRIDKLIKIIITYENGEVLTIDGDSINKEEFQAVLEKINQYKVDHTEVIGEERDA